MKWKEILLPKGEYISPSFDVSSELGRVLAEMSLQVVNPHNQTLNIYVSTSKDKEVWSDWRRVEDGGYGFLSDVSSHQLFLRYKVHFSSEDTQKKPYLQKITFLFTPSVLLINHGDLPIKPKLWITKKSTAGSAKIKNMMTGQVLELDNISRGEEVFVDGENEELISSNQSLGVYRYDNHNDEWLELLPGENHIQGVGVFDLDVRMQGRLLAD